tara:strand:+ start:12169 stop:12498 length:330 start_codon:yes stop_codon:yes gene_type:complete
MSKEIDLYLKNQLIGLPKLLKNYLKESKEYDMGITYYTGNWSKDLKDNLTERQEEKLRNQMEKLSDSLHFFTRKLPDNVGGYHYVAYVKGKGEPNLKPPGDTRSWIDMK